MSDTPEPPPLTEREMAELRSMYGVYQVNRALERLRWLEAENADIKDRIATALLDKAAVERGVMRLRAEVAALKAERDKERRDACRSDAYAVHGVYTPEELAKGRGWDCFKEGTEQC